MLLYSVGDLDYVRLLSTRPPMELELQNRWAAAAAELSMYGYDMEGNISGSGIRPFRDYLTYHYPAMYEASSYVQMAKVAGELIGLGMADGIAKVIGASIAQDFAAFGMQSVSDIYVDGWVEGGEYGAGLGLYEMVIVLDPYAEQDYTKHYWAPRYAMRYGSALYWGDVAGWDVYGRTAYVPLAQLGDMGATGVPGEWERGEQLPDVWNFNGGWIDDVRTLGVHEIKIYERAYAEFQGMLRRIPEGYYIDQEVKGAPEREGWEPGNMRDWEEIGEEPRFSIESRT